MKDSNKIFYGCGECPHTLVVNSTPNAVRLTHKRRLSLGEGNTHTTDYNQATHTLTLKYECVGRQTYAICEFWLHNIETGYPLAIFFDIETASSCLAGLGTNLRIYPDILDIEDV